MIHTFKGFSVVKKAELLECFYPDVFWNSLVFFCDPVDVGNLTSVSSAFSKFSFYIRNFSVYILLKPSLKNYENNFASMLNECNCAVI